jgi:hypothetical protein
LIRRGLSLHRRVYIFHLSDFASTSEDTHLRCLKSSPSLAEPGSI